MDLQEEQEKAQEDSSKLFRECVPFPSLSTRLAFQSHVDKWNIDEVFHIFGVPKYTQKGTPFFTGFFVIATDSLVCVVFFAHGVICLHRSTAQHLYLSTMSNRGDPNRSPTFPVPSIVLRLRLHIAIRRDRRWRMHRVEGKPYTPSQHQLRRCLAVWCSLLRRRSARCHICWRQKLMNRL